MTSRLRQIATPQVFLLLAVAALAGCANMMGGGYTAWKVTDPPQNSPYNEPALSATPAQPRPQATARPAMPEEPGGPEVTIRQRPDAPAPGPALGERGGLDQTTAGLSLRVSAPDSAAVGEPIPFEATIANAGQKGALNVVLECEFGDGLEFPGRAERRIRRPIGALSAGASQRAPLALNSLRTGRHCVVFRLTADGHDAVEREVCVDVSAPDIELQVVGPERRVVGQRAEYVVTILNRSDRELEETRVNIRHDAALAAREASAGAVREDQQLSWDLGTLRRDERVQIQVEFECLAEKPGACASVRVVAADAANSREACVEIVAADGPVGLSVSDAADPVAVGEDCVFRIEVENRGPEVLEDWTLLLAADDLMEISSARLTGGAEASALTLGRQGGSDILSGLPALPAGGSATMEVQARCVREGTAVLHVTLPASSTRTAVDVVETTVVNPPATVE